MAAVDSPSGVQGSGFFPISLEPYLEAVMLECFCYGVYTVLFSICAYVLLRRRHRVHRILPFFAVAMFSLATVDMAYTLWLLFGKLLKLELSYQALRWKYWMYVTNNVLGDSLLLYRCYVVWDNDKRVLVGSALLLLAATVCGYVLQGSLSTTLLAESWIYPLITLILNLILTILTASRIWFLSRKARHVLGPNLSQRYNVTLSILIESGIIYSLYMAVDLAFHNNANGRVILGASLIQVVGIMPTLIIAQIAVGRAVHDNEPNFRGGHIESSQSAPGITPISCKMQIKTTTESILNIPLADGIGACADTRRPMFDVSLPSAHSPYKTESGYSGHNSTSSGDTFASPETRARYNPQEHYRHKFESLDAAILDLPRDIEKGHDEARFYEMDPGNGSVLDFVLREDVEKGLENGEIRTPSPATLCAAKEI